MIRNKRDIVASVVNTTSKRMKQLSQILLSTIIFMSLGENGFSAIPNASINPCDTLLTVPEGITGEDSIAYIENDVFQSPISAADLLSLTEVHTVEERLYRFNYHIPEEANEYLPNKADSAALRLANRVMRMNYLVIINGNAADELQFAIAVNAAIDSFHIAEPSIPRDSILDEVIRVIDKFSVGFQEEINFQSYVSATIDYYRTIESYRQLISNSPTNLSPLLQKEYEAWHELNNARFAFWNDLSYTWGWYSMRPMETENYYENLSANRRAELQIEREIIEDRKPYFRQGKKVSNREWKRWVIEHSFPIDADPHEIDSIPEEELVNQRVGSLENTLSKWLAARHDVAKALSNEQRKSYENLTVDMHCRMIGKLELIVPLYLLYQ